MTWDRSCHRYPCPETDHIDRVLNEIEETTLTLSAEMERYCARVANSRNLQSRGRKNVRVGRASDFSVNLTGARGECATSHYLGLPYRGTVNEFRRADLPFNIEVRTRSNPFYDLKVRPDDDDGRRVVMAVTTGPGQPVRLMGWIVAAEGKKFPLVDPRDALLPFHAVPKDSLRPMRELRAIAGKGPY